MGKIVPIEDRAVYRVAAYLTKKDHTALEKLAVKKKASVSSLVALIIKESISNQTRTPGV
jgi:hypothetical protein